MLSFSYMNAQFVPLVRKTPNFDYGTFNEEDLEKFASLEAEREKKLLENSEKQKAQAQKLGEKVKEKQFFECAISDLFMQKIYSMALNELLETAYDDLAQKSEALDHFFKDILLMEREEFTNNEIAYTYKLQNNLAELLVLLDAEKAKILVFYEIFGLLEKGIAFPLNIKESLVSLVSVIYNDQNNTLKFSEFNSFVANMHASRMFTSLKEASQGKLPSLSIPQEEKIKYLSNYMTIPVPGKKEEKLFAKRNGSTNLFLRILNYIYILFKGTSIN